MSITKARSAKPVVATPVVAKSVKPIPKTKPQIDQQPTRDFKAEFAAQRPLPKKEVMKLKPGTFVELRWLDSPNTVGLLTEKPANYPGDVTIEVHEVATGDLWPRLQRFASVCHDQVVEVRGTLAPMVVPEPRAVAKVM